MAQHTITAKELFLKEWDDEHQITLKLLKMFPSDRADFKPAEKSKSARELAWMFVSEENLIGKVIQGAVEMSAQHPMPSTSFHDIIVAYERAHHDNLGKLKSWRDEDLETAIKFPVGPRQMGEMRKADICWFMLKDEIHHRGQLSVYLRLVGAKVPSIYGPSADEPWM